MSAQYSCVVPVSLYLFNEGTSHYDNLEDVHCTIVGTVEGAPLYKLGCYNSSNTYVCTATITSNNDTGACVALQGNYVSFRDDEKRLWSMQFATETDAVEFCGHVAVAMYGASGQPKESIVFCSVARNKDGKKVLAGGRVEVQYRSWVVQCESGKKSVPKLGSLLESSAATPTFVTVPPNHASVTSAMKGFEGLLVGAQTGGSFFAVIPVGCQQGEGPQINKCFFIQIGAKCDDDGAGEKDGGGALALVAEPKRTTDLSNGTYRREAEGGWSSSAPSGFSREQFLLVDRLRDQVFTLTEQLRETRRQLDFFDTEVKKHEKSRRPRSLAAAQIEFSVDKLIAGTEEHRERLDQKRTAVHLLKEKNDELRARLLKFSATKKTLTDEANAVLNDRNEEKVELDRKVTNTQERLLRLQSEVEDNSRLLATMKNLTVKTEDELQQEKHQLHVRVTELSANEAKLAAVQDKYMTEVTTRDTLTTKAAGLEESIKEMNTEKEVKERQLESKNRKLESDRLHFAQVIDDERKQSVTELRDVRQQLVAELAARDERFQAAKERAADEAYERGRAQGKEDGQAEAFMEGDLRAQQLTITVQRLRAEEEAMRARLRTAVEERALEERQLLAQMKSLRQTVEQVRKENTQLAEEAHALRLSAEAAEHETYTDLEEVLRSTTVPISQRALFVLLDNLNNHTSFDRSVLQRDAAEARRVLEEDYSAVVNWVRTTAYNQPHPCPPLRPLFYMDKPLSAANMGQDLFVANTRVSSENSGGVDMVERR